jgi:hypothetical protein
LSEPLPRRTLTSHLIGDRVRRRRVMDVTS